MKEDWAWVFKILLEEVLIIEIFEKYTFIFTFCVLWDLYFGWSYPAYFQFSVLKPKLY